MDFWRNSKKYAWILGVSAGIILIAAGAVTGQAVIIWRKAVMICLECIGIG